MKWVVPVVGVLLGIVLVVFLSLPDTVEGTPPIYHPRISSDLQRVKSADPGKPEGMTELRTLLMSSEFNVATQAGMKLALQYPEGFLALAGEAQGMSPELRIELFDRRISASTRELAALAVKTGSAHERAGGYLILESNYGGIGPIPRRMIWEWEREEVFDALSSRIPLADKKELESIEALMPRFLSSDPEKNLVLLSHRFAAVRAEAVRRLGYFGGEKAVKAVRALASDPDPRVRAEVKIALELIVRAAKANADLP
jgi:hypothetical protein